MSKIFRLAIIVVVITTFVNAMAIIGVGLYRSIHAYILLAQTGTDDRPGIHIVESLDTFLIAFVFLMMSLGFMKLFVPDFSWFKGIDLPWLKINDFSQLKTLLWSTLLLTLVVSFSTSILKTQGQLEYTMLIVPASVLFFSLALKFLPH